MRLKKLPYFDICTRGVQKIQKYRKLFVRSQGKFRSHFSKKPWKFNFISGSVLPQFFPRSRRLQFLHFLACLSDCLTDPKIEVRRKCELNFFWTFLHKIFCTRTCRSDNCGWKMLRIVGPENLPPTSKKDVECLIQKKIPRNFSLSTLNAFFTTPRIFSQLVKNFPIELRDELKVELLQTMFSNIFLWTLWRQIWQPAKKRQKLHVLGKTIPILLF